MQAWALGMESQAPGQLGPRQLMYHGASSCQTGEWNQTVTLDSPAATRAPSLGAKVLD